jgi:hypothetical protein
VTKNFVVNQRARNFGFCAIALLAHGPSAFGATLSLKDYTGPECGSDPIFERVKSCGVELFINSVSSACTAITETREHPSCGPLYFKTAETASCGAATYNSRASAAECGNEEKVEWGFRSCDSGSHELAQQGYSGLVELETSYHVSSSSNPYSDGKGQTTGTTTWKCKGFKPKTCSHPNFGEASYKSCEHPDHGVAQWNTCSVTVGYEQCRHESHGEELYKSCQTSKANKTCQVYLRPDEIPVYVTTQKDEVDFKVKNVLKWAATFHKVRGDGEKLGCLINNITFDPNLTGIVVVQAAILNDLKVSFKDISGKDFDPADFSLSICQSPLQKIKKIICLPSDPSTTCSALSGFKDAVVDLEATRDELNLLIEDIVVKANLSALAELTSMQTSVSGTLLQTNIP